MSSTTTTGSCLCNACTYAYTGSPALKAICHCISCRKISGGSNTVNYAVPEVKFSVTGGSPKSFSKDHEYGMVLTVFFCPDCGSALWKEATAEQLKGFKLVQAGTLTESEKLDDGVDAEFYTTTRVPWLVALSGVDKRTEF
ncbi:Glutathione-dependent formaldehyde-activating enzyme/centromere protein V [Penicillium canescens]|nr:Glutathione-dependent formaldehyde-activating enzyme/centromere protein V [Penicillium canescens]